ncbi:MAG: bifunctional folylpolyglutamate synthase/dihydrofolate synthase [Planctomycetota bacterium]|jgi:dihydrofolate synthase/folylpolyglutamate synthase
MRNSAWDRAFERLAGLTNYETMATVRYDSRTYGLGRARRLLADLGRPCHGRTTIQVVGSKGKGSAAAACGAVLRAGGQRTGTFLSPHLEHPKERVLVDGKPVSGQRFEAAVDRVLSVARLDDPARRPTFFELMTAVARLIFEESGVDVALLEAGMGGRLDSTTASRRDALILTGISRDHVRQLGCTLSAIAAEKIAAARRGMTVHSAVRDGSPQGRVVRERCRAVGARLRVSGRDFSVENAATEMTGGGPRTSFDLRFGDDAVLAGLELPVLGVHQADNAAVAVASLLDLSRRGLVDLDEGDVRRGLRRLRSPARLEVMGRRPLVLLDGAHNGASMKAAAAALHAVLPSGGRLRVVLAMQKDKEFDDCLRALPASTRLVVTEVPGPRCKPAAELATRARANGLRATVVRDAASALRGAMKDAGPDDVVLVTGSLYLAGALRPHFAG